MRLVSTSRVPVRHAYLMLSLMLSVLCVARGGRAQSEEDAGSGGPIENRVVDRDVAFRLRAEVQFSDDSEELIDADPAYAAYPAKIYNASLAAICRDRMLMSVQASMWENPQDLDTTRWGWRLRLPIGKGFTGSVKYTRWNTDEGTERDYFYLATDTTLGSRLYSFTQYRHSTEDGSVGENQLSQYLSYKPSKRFRIGGQAAFADKVDAKEDGAWYARGFGSFYLFPGRTSIRLDARHYDTGGDLVFQDYNMYLYQKVGERSFLRFLVRLYSDNDDLSSQAFGVKVKHHFAPRFSVHGGYRWYDHSEGTDLETFHAGFALIF